MPGYLLWICTDLFLAFGSVALAFVIARGLEGDFRWVRVRWALWLLYASCDIWMDGLAVRRHAHCSEI